MKKGLLTCIEREVAPGPVTGGAQFRLPTLSAAQRKAAEEIRAAFADRATVLLRGVTGSGKTEIYMHFAAEVLARAREAVRGIHDRVVKSPECKGVTILCDVDPQ